MIRFLLWYFSKRQRAYRHLFKAGALLFDGANVRVTDRTHAAWRDCPSVTIRPINEPLTRKDYTTPINPKP